MLYAFTEEQDELRAVVRRCLDDHRKADPTGRPDGVDVDLWQRLAALGIAGLAIAEDAGGSGGDVIDQVVVAEILGEFAAPVPFVGHSLAVAALIATGTETQRQRWLPGLLAGEMVGGCVTAGPGVEPAADFVASPSADGWLVTGTAPMLFDASAAGCIVFCALTDDGPRLFAAERPPLRVLASVDGTRPFAELELVQAPAEPLSDAVPAAVVMPRLVGLARTLLSAEAAGVAAAMLEATSVYARERHQFGRPIGTFQAVKHRLAGMLCSTENARSAAYGAAWALADDAENWPIAVAMAQAVATEVAVDVASSAVQLHGGLGMTWECGLHVYLRRAKTLQVLFGEPGWHYERIAASLLEA